MPGRDSLRDRLLRLILMRERYIKFYAAHGDPMGVNEHSPWIFYDGRYFAATGKTTYESWLSDPRMSDHIRKVSSYHKG